MSAPPRAPLWDGRDILLDSSALLAFCLNETGADAVAEALSTAATVRMTATNVAECASKLIRMGWDPDATESMMQELEITVVQADLPLGMLAGELHARTRSRGLSTGDALCLAAALRDDQPVFTADRAWGTIGLGIEVVVIRD